MGILLLVISAVCTAAGNIMLKSTNGKLTAVTLYALAAFTANIAVYNFALKYLPVATAYIITTAISFVFIAVLSWFMFKEQMSTIQIIGCAVVFAGLAMIVFGKR